MSNDSTTYHPEGCIAAAKSHEGHAAHIRKVHKDEKIATWLERWAAWWRDRAESKPGADVLPEPPR